MFYFVEYKSETGTLLLSASNGKLTLCKWKDTVNDDVTPRNINDFPDEDNKIINDTIGELDEYFSGNRKVFSIPILLKGTPFEIKVLEELRKIPFGRTVSYSEIAKRIGQPKACRAVARVCKKNLLTIIIPCHRVISKSGSPGGYNGGLDKKLYLLQIEKIHI